MNYPLRALRAKSPGSENISPRDVHQSSSFSVFIIVLRSSGKQVLLGSPNRRILAIFEMDHSIPSTDMSITDFTNPVQALRHVLLAGIVILCVGLNFPKIMILDDLLQYLLSFV
jgi:hypothetical protein